MGWIAFRFCSSRKNQIKQGWHSIDHVWLCFYFFTLVAHWPWNLLFYSENVVAVFCFRLILPHSMKFFGTCIASDFCWSRCSFTVLWNKTCLRQKHKTLTHSRMPFFFLPLIAKWNSGNYFFICLGPSTITKIIHRRLHGDIVHCYPVRMKPAMLQQPWITRHFPSTPRTRHCLWSRGLTHESLADATDAIRWLHLWFCSVQLDYSISENKCCGFNTNSCLFCARNEG